MSVRACACCFSVNPIEKRKEKGAREIVKWGRTQKKKGLCRRELIRRPFRAFWSGFFFSFFFSFFFLLLFSFPFSIFSFPPNRLPMPNAQTPNKRQKDTKLKGEKKTQLRKFVCHKIISYVTRIGDWIHFENSQRDDTTIRKDVRITQWPRKTPH